MAKILYCWRCKMELPMLDGREWELLVPHLAKAFEKVKEYRTEHSVSLREAYDVAFGKSALAVYREITGFDESAFGALWHHRASLFGPPCAKCGKPLRTPNARHCAECGAVRG